MSQAASTERSDGKSVRRRRLLVSGIACAVALLVLNLIFWWFRIFTSGSERGMSIGVADLYTEHIPTISHTFEAMRHGRIPLWNPYQFCGSPFLAQGWTGAFYPPRWINLFADVFTSLEVLLVFHMVLGGLGMWVLAQHFGLGPLAGLCAGTTFMWSYWPMMHTAAPAVLEALSWIPIIVLMMERVMLGRRLAWLGLVAALTCQLFIGLLEVTLHTAYVVAIFTICRFVSLRGRDAWLTALRRLGIAVAAVTAAVLLSMPNTLPMLELVQQSARAAGSLTFKQTMMMGTVTPFEFLRGALGQEHYSTVGILPVVAIPLALASRDHRTIWIGCILAAVTAMFFTFGGQVWYAYYSIPILGSTFRRPLKFLNVYVFVQALVAGVAIARLWEWAATERRDLWRNAGWLAAVLVSGAALACTIELELVYVFAAILFGALVLFGTLPWVTARRAAVVAVCLVQAASLFFTISNHFVRPISQPEVYEKYARVLDRMASPPGASRTYISPKFAYEPGLTPRMGTMRKMEISIDYEPLAIGRYAAFFDRLANVQTRAFAPFMGYYELTPQTHWPLMDLTGTKFFVLRAGDPMVKFLAVDRDRFLPAPYLSSPKSAQVFVQKSFLARAFVVPRARILPQPSDVLAALDAPGIDVGKEVLLERMPVEGLPPPDAPDAKGTVTIDSYEPEQVTLTATLTAPGFLLLNDANYPGWEATVGDRPVPIYQANYLFRAVRLDAGVSKVRFTFRPRSFRLGVILFMLTMTAIAVGVAVDLRYRRPRPTLS